MGKGTFSCVKWLLTVFNFIFLIFGLAICSIGVWMFVSPSIIHEIIGPNLTPILGYILLGSGGTIILVSFCGCAGAVLENRCLLCLFFTVLCGVFVAGLVASILVGIFKKDLSDLTTDRLSNYLRQHYGLNGSQSWTDFWDLVQSNFSCCAVENDKSFVIYQKTPWFKYSKQAKVPSSCCKKFDNGSFINLNECQRGNKNYLYPTGCMHTILRMFNTKYIIILTVLITLAVVLIFGMILSLCHLRNIINVRYIEYSHPI